MTDHDDLARRIEELEEEVRHLRGASHPTADAQTPLTRRRLLGRAGVAAAVAAGAVASPALMGKAAAADDGNMILGDANTATSETSLTRDAAGPALTLDNSSTGVGLRLNATDPDTVDAGDLFMDSGGYFWGAFDTDAAGVFFDSSFAAYPVLLEPFRVLDTRQAGATSNNFGRSRVSNPTNKFDGSGRLKAGSSINLKLSDFSFFGLGAILNVTVTGATGGGFLRSWPTTLSTAPNASIINYATGQTIANGLTLPIGYDTADDDSISFDANQGATHVIVDISGLIVFDPGSVVGFSAGVASAAATQRRFRQRRMNERQR